MKSTVDYIMVRQEDKAKIRNVKVITSEECVPKHKLLVMDMRFKATKRGRRKQVEEAKWKGLGVNDHWQQMKGIMMETVQDICGMTKGPPRHKETWWWNEEVAEAVRNKKIKYGKCKKKTLKRQGWSLRRVDKMRRGLSLQQRKRNRRNGQTT